MNMIDRFAGKGVDRGFVPGKTGGIGERTVVDNRKPIYLTLILDKSGSMGGTSTVFNENGEPVTIPKIEQLNDGLKRVTKSLKDFERDNPLYRVYLQIIELDSYGKAVFPEFQPVSRGFEEIRFEADGCTELRASLNTLKTFISHKYLRDDRPEREGRGYNKAVSVILMSDGWPTDSNGIEQKGPAYRNVIDEFNQYLIEMDYARNVDRYSIAVGDDACEDMLRYFSDGDEDLGENSRFYRVEACESIASALDYMTRASLAHHTTSPVANDFDDDDEEVEDEYEDEYEDEEELDDDDEDIDEEDDFSDDEELDEEPDEDHSSDEEKAVAAPAAETAKTKYQIDIVKCKKDRCMECLGNKCPVSAIEIHSGIISINADICNGCGRCEAVCPYGAISKGETDTMLDDLFDGID